MFNILQYKYILNIFLKENIKAIASKRGKMLTHLSISQSSNNFIRHIHL